MTLLGKLLGHDRRHLEYVFDATSVTTFVRSAGAEDVRTMSEKIMLRKPRPEGPAWALGPEGAAFLAGGGALGQGSLWTRPIELEAIALEGAHFQFVERRVVNGGAGGVSIVAHVRDRAVVGEGPDVASERFPVHAHEDASDEVWHNTVLDLLPLVSKHLGAGRFLTIEIVVESSRGAPNPRAIDVQFRPPALTLVTSPDSPVPAWD